MKNRIIITALALVAGSGWSARPNILFILADDHSWEAVGHVGGEVRTPNLDRLAAGGVSFRHAYNMGSWSGAVCVASRHMFNMGRFVWNCNAVIGPKKKKGESKQSGTPKVKAWSQRLHEAGYTTYFAGKWHVSYYDPEAVFDCIGTVRPGMPEQTEAGYNRPLSREDKNWLPWDTSRGGFWEGGTHWSEVLRDEAVGFIEQAAKKPEPFFMYLAFNAPHDPRQAPKEFVELYPPESIRVPQNFLPRYPYDKQIGCDKKLRDARLAPFPRTEYAVQVNRREYYASITHMDEQIGRILDALKKSGKLDNTYIIYTADHGLAVGHHGLIGKQNMYEHSLGAPLIINGPGLEPGRRIMERVYIQDVVPATLELAGQKIPEEIDFESLLPLAFGTSQKGREVIYGAYKKNLQRCVIRDSWKLIHYPQVPVYRLYNLAADPEEMNDLAANPEYAARLQKMKNELAAEMKRQHDPL